MGNIQHDHDKTIGDSIRGTFSLQSNSIRTSTIALLMDSFYREQSMTTKGPFVRNVSSVS